MLPVYESVAWALQVLSQTFLVSETRIGIFREMDHLVVCGLCCCCFMDVGFVRVFLVFGLLFFFILM